MVRKRHGEVGIGARVKRVRSAQESLKRGEKREKWLIKRVGAQSVNADDEDMRVLGGDLLRKRKASRDREGRDEDELRHGHRRNISREHLDCVV